MATMETRTDSRLATILFEVNCAVSAAIDEKLRELIPERPDIRLWIKDRHLPRLHPAIEATVVQAIRDVSPTLPEELDLDPEFVAKTKAQLEASLTRVGAVIASEGRS